MPPQPKRQTCDSAAGAGGPKARVALSDRNPGAVDRDVAPVIEVVRSEDVGSIKNIKTLSQGAGEIGSLKKNGYFERRPHPAKASIEFPIDWKIHRSGHTVRTEVLA